MEKQHYVEYLLSTNKNHTCTHLAAHKQELSHDKITRFLYNSNFTSQDLWGLVKTEIDDSSDAFIIVDDSVQEKQYSKFIELVKLQYSGNKGGLVKGINLVNMVHSNGTDGDYYPVDYRIYAPDEDEKSKNTHFQEMFKSLVEDKKLQCRTILFDSWYASLDNLKTIHRSGWTFFTTLKSNRKVSLSKDTGYQNLDELHFSEQEWVKGIEVKLKNCPFMVKLFRIVSKDGSTEWLITNSLSNTTNVFVAEQNNDIRWQVEQFHREYNRIAEATTDRFRKMSMPKSYIAKKSFGMLLSCLVNFEIESETDENNFIPS